MNKLFIACAMTLALTACGGVSSHSGVTAAQKEKGLFGTNKDAIDVSTGKAFAGTKDVVIGGFLVGFDIRSSASRKAGGGLFGSSQGGRSSATMELLGMDDATFQQITDAAYSDFVADLKAQGYNVVNRDVLLADGEFTKTKAEKSPYVESSGGMLAAKQDTRYFAPSSFGGAYIFPGDIIGKNGGFGYNNPATGAAKFASEDGKPAVLHVSYVIDFAATTGHGGRFSDTSSLKVGQGLSVATGSRVGIIKGQSGSFSSNQGTIALGQPIDSGKQFGTLIDNTSDASKATQIALNVMGTIGGLGTNASRNYQIQAEPAKYKAASLEALKKANDTLVGEMAKLK